MEFAKRIPLRIFVILISLDIHLASKVFSICNNSVPTDLVFILDSTSSVLDINLLKQVNFVQNVIRDFDIGPTKTRVGLITYSDGVKVFLSLNESSTRTEVVAAVQAAADTSTRITGRSNVADALRYLWTTMLDPVKGGSRADPDVVKIGIVVTDGVSIRPHLILFHAGFVKIRMTMFAIGVGDGSTREKLDTIATSDDRVYHTKDFEGLLEQAKVIKNRLNICPRRGEYPGHLNAPSFAASPTGQHRRPLWTPPELVIRRPPSRLRDVLQVAALSFGGVSSQTANQPIPCRGDICDQGAARPTEPPARPDPLSRSCGGKPADVVFVLDSSSSIWGPDFQKQLNFISNVIDIFDVSHNMTHIGVMTYSDLANAEFKLNAYTSKRDIGRAIRNITQPLGETYTGDAIRYMREVMFSTRNGARPEVAKVGIVITDGLSAVRGDTFAEASRTRDAGIHLIAIGVGREVDELELKGIANDPDSMNVFMVNNYRALGTIKELLAIRACEVKSTTSPNTQLCGLRKPADIVFVMDTPNAGQAQTKSIVQFIRNVIKEIEVNEDKNQVALIPKHCVQIPGFLLDEYTSRTDLLSDLEDFSVPDTYELLRQLRQHVLGKEHGGRRNARKVAILITDRKRGERNTARALREAQKNKLNDVEVFTVGIGEDTDRRVLRELASSPQRTHAFRVERHSEVDSLTKDILKYICGVSYKMMMEQLITRRGDAPR